MVIWVIEFPRERYKIRYILAQKSTYSEEIIIFLELVMSRQKLGVILENKVLQKLKLSKRVDIKNVLLNIVQ
jgi:hypothetical protein